MTKKMTKINLEDLNLVVGGATGEPITGIEVTIVIDEDEIEQSITAKKVVKFKAGSELATKVK